MVREINPDGRLKLTELGGFAWNTVEGEGCTILTQDGRKYRGSLLLNKASGHIFGEEVGSTERNADTLSVRIDERTSSAEQTLQLGIQVGDYVAFDPRLEISASGFIRSRHLDDKAGVACLIAAAQSLAAAGLQPAQSTTLALQQLRGSRSRRSGRVPPRSGRAGRGGHGRRGRGPGIG